MFDLPWGDLLPFFAVGVVVADASVAIRGDLGGFHQDLNRAKADTGTLGDKLKSALSPKNIIAGAGLLGITVGLKSLIGFAGDAAAGFQELQQTQRTTDEVFGKSASVIEDWAERAAEAAGMSKRTVFQSAAIMGQTLENMGFSAEEAAEKVVLLQQRASEMAIAFGQTPERAILAITAAMRGERDTIEKFGVSIKQVDVNARVAALGLDTSTGAAKKNAEAMAILDLILEQTSAQAGRFAEGQDDMAVKMAVAKAHAENLENQFGQMVTEIENGAFIVADAVGDGFATASGAVDDFFKLGFDPRIGQLAESLGIAASDAQTMVSSAMSQTGQDFDSTIEDMLESAYTLGEGGAESFDHFTAAFTAMGQSVQGTASGVGDVVAFAVPAAILAHWDSIKQAGIDTMTAYNQGIFESQSSFIAEIDALLKALDENLEPGEEISLLRGKKMSLMLARGIEEGKDVPDLGAIAAIDNMIAQINSRLATLNGYSYGKNLALTMSQGIKDYTQSAQISAYALGGIIRAGVGINSEPTDPNSPLRGITKWGGNIVKTIADGIYGELGTGTAATRALAGALVPSLGGVGALGMAGTAVMAGSGNTYVLNVGGVQYQVGSAEEAIKTLQDLGVFGEGRVN